MGTALLKVRGKESILELSSVNHVAWEDAALRSFSRERYPIRPRLSGRIQLYGRERLAVAGAGRLLIEQVVLAVAGVVCVVGVRNAVGSWNLLFQDPTVSVLWRCPTLPHPPRCSTIGACGLSFQVRNGCWAFPRGYDHHKIVNHIFS